MLKKKPADTSNRILPGIQCFAWSPDRSMVAVCPQSKEILIFATNSKPDIKDWRLVEVLKEVSKSTTNPPKLSRKSHPSFPTALQQLQLS